MSAAPGGLPWSWVALAGLLVILCVAVVGLAAWYVRRGSARSGA